MKTIPLPIPPTKSKKHNWQAIVGLLFALLVIAASVYAF